MSSLWTPDGERPVRSPEADPAESDPLAGLTAEDLAEMEQVRTQLAATPASVVVANHCFGFFELAALHLSLQPPQLGDAQVAIDALAAVVEALSGRLGDAEGQLKEAVAQLRLAFVQIRAANLGTATPPPEA